MLSPGGEDSNAVRAAWLHYAGGLTQAEVARRLGLSNLKAHRLITKANQEGLVKIFIDGDVTECFELEQQLSQKYQLDFCEVAPELETDEDLPLRTLGMAGARFLMREIARPENLLIGIGHGRTLGACVDNLPAKSTTNTEFVSLLGGLIQNFSVNPHDVMHRLAHQTGATSYVMPVPFFADSEKDRAVLLGQRGVKHVYKLIQQTQLKFVGIGTSRPESSMIGTGMIHKKELTKVARAGGVGELLGHFFTADGVPMQTELSSRTTSPPLSKLKGDRIVAVAGGVHKDLAIRSVLESRLISGLITDERTARALAC